MAKRSNRKETAVRDATKEVAALPMPPWFKRDWFWGLVLVLGVFLAYSPVWWAGYIWDDDGRLTANPCIVGPLGLKEIWTTSQADLCPLVYTAFWMEHALWGLAPLPYHLVNVLLHGASAILLWRVLRELRVPGAWIGAALWAFHPVQVETAAWITEMKNTQSCLFYLLTILFFLKFLREVTGWNYGLALLFGALAMASKSSTVILPITLGLCAWWVEGRWQWRNLARLAPFALLAILPALLTLWTQTVVEHGYGDEQYARSLPERVATAGDAIWFYLGKLIWPHPLIFIYPRWQIDAGSLLSWLPLLAVIIVMFVLWRWRTTWARPYFFAFAYFVGALLPVLGLIDGYFWRFSLVGDHLQYLASMGPLALVGAGLVRLGDVVGARTPWLQPALYAGLLFIYGTLSWQRAWVFGNIENLWTDTLNKNPGCWMAHNNLGMAFFQSARLDAAIAQFQQAVEIKPNYDEALSNLGDALLHKGRLNEAMDQCRQAVAINPYFAEGYNNLGNVLLHAGRVNEAMVQFQKALNLKPNYAAIHNNIASALFREGQIDAAMDQCQQALALNPNFAEAHNNLGYALLQKGQPDLAMAHYEKALEINPRYAEADYNLGVVYLQKGQVDQAIEQCQRALAIDPNYADAHYNLGNALAQKGQLDDAITEYQWAATIKPNFADAHNNLGTLLLRRGRFDEAIGQFQKTLEINPKYAVAYNNLGIAFVQKKQIEQAIAEFREALKLNPGYGDAKSNLTEAMALQKPGHK